MEVRRGSSKQKEAAENHRRVKSPQRASASKEGTRGGHEAAKDSTPADATQTSPHRPIIGNTGLSDESRDAAPPPPGTETNKTTLSPQRHPSVFRRGQDERRFTRPDLAELEWNARAPHSKPSIHGLPSLDGLGVTDKGSDSDKLGPKLVDLITTVDDMNIVTPGSPSRLPEKKKPTDKIKKNKKVQPVKGRHQPCTPPLPKQQPGEQSKRLRVKKVVQQEGTFSPDYKYLEPALEELISKEPEGPLEGAVSEGQSELQKTNLESLQPTSHLGASSEYPVGEGTKRPKGKREDLSLKRHGSRGKSQSDTMTTLLKFLGRSSKSSDKGDQAGNGLGKLRTGKMRATLCAFVVTFALVGALLLSFMQTIFLADTKGKMLYRCHTRECLDFRNNLTALLNNNADPCEDFYGYVCDNWLKETGAVSFVDYTIKGFHRKINSTLLSDSPLQPDKDGMHILSALYTSCYHFMTTRSTSLAQIVAYASQSLNVSSVFHVKSSAELFTYLIENALTKGFHTWFSIQFQYKGKKAYMYIRAETSIRRFIERTIEEAGPGNGNYSFAKRMSSYVQDVLRLLYREKDVEYQAQQLTKWDSMIDNVLQAQSVQQYKPFTSIASVFHPMSVKDVAEMFNRMTPPNLALEPEDEVLVHGYNAMVKIVSIMNNGTDTSKVLYFAVHLVTNLARFLFLREQVSGDPYATIVACFKVTQQSLFHTWPYLITRKMKYDGRAVETRNLADDIRTSTINSEMFYWMSKSSVRRALSDLHQLDFVVYEESRIPDMNLMYQDFKIANSDFLSAYLDIKRIETGVLLRWLPADTGHALSMHQASSVLSLRAFRVESIQRIFVPSAYQSFPMFRYHPETVLPFYINYPTVGVLVAKEMIRAVGPPPKWDATTRRIYQKYASCLKTVQASLGLHSDVKEDDWEFESFAWSFGSLSAYEAVRSKFLARGTDFYEKYFATAQQIYFILSCQMTCSSLQEAHPISPREQCLLPLHSNADFLRYYNCSQKAVLTCVSSLFSVKNE